MRQRGSGAGGAAQDSSAASSSLDAATVPAEAAAALTGARDAVHEIGVRERKHRETAARITYAAVELFERNGSAGTTVDDIAELAEVSARTVFRYFPSKEHAVFAPEHRIEQQIRDTLDSGSLQDGVEGIIRQAVRMLDELEQDLIAREVILRVRKLFFHDERLLSVARQVDGERIERMVALLAEQSDPALSRQRIRMWLDAVSAIVRESLELWAAGHADGPRAAGTRIVADYRAMLAGRPRSRAEA